MKNPHYMPNEKNGGIPPTCEDKRLEYIKVGCGWCEECRRQIASNWRIRLTEEFIDNQRCEFVTLSFSPEWIEKLERDIITNSYKGVNGTEIDVNILAAYAIRHWQERWRKKFKKSNRHWIITEIGHKNSERIHLHGLIWQTHENISRQKFREEICNSWTYGNVYIGKWVDHRTINYITKYITKNDAQHEGYRPRTFVSKGLGLGYIERKGRFMNDTEHTRYKASNGRDYALPRYYKDKIYTEDEKTEIWKKQLDKNEVWLNGAKYDITKSDEVLYRKNWISALEAVRDSNKRKGYQDNENTPYKYIVTEAMKTHYKDDNITDKMTQRTRRREIRETKEYDEIEEIGKTWNVRKEVYGNYIGTTTEGERKKNAEMEEAAEMHVSVRMLRLIKKGIVEKPQ